VFINHKNIDEKELFLQSKCLESGSPSTPDLPRNNSILNTYFPSPNSARRSKDSERYDPERSKASMLRLDTGNFIPVTRRSVPASTSTPSSKAMQQHLSSPNLLSNTLQSSSPPTSPSGSPVRNIIPAKPPRNLQHRHTKSLLDISTTEKVRRARENFEKNESFPSTEGSQESEDKERGSNKREKEKEKEKKEKEKSKENNKDKQDLSRLLAENAELKQKLKKKKEKLEKKGSKITEKNGDPSKKIERAASDKTPIKRAGNSVTTPSSNLPNSENERIQVHSGIDTQRLLLFIQEEVVLQKQFEDMMATTTSLNTVAKENIQKECTTISSCFQNISNILTPTTQFNTSNSV